MAQNSCTESAKLTSNLHLRKFADRKKNTSIGNVSMCSTYRLLPFFLYVSLLRSIGIDTEEHEETKERYKFPYSDFEKVHRCGVLAAESRAGQYKYYDIERATAHLHAMIDAAKRSK